MPPTHIPPPFVPSYSLLYCKEFIFTKSYIVLLVSEKKTVATQLLHVVRWDDLGLEAVHGEDWVDDYLRRGERSGIQNSFIMAASLLDYLKELDQISEVLLRLIILYH